MNSLVKVQPNYESSPAHKQVNHNANSWAGRITQKVSPIVIAKIQEDEKRVKAENAAKLAKKNLEQKMEQQRKREEYERNYEANMQRKHGLKKAFVVPPIETWRNEEVLPIGSFWEFMVECSRDESEFAKSRRKDPENRRKFHSYLAEKYGLNWLEASEDTEDNCVYLCDLRYKDQMDQEQAYWEQQESERKMLAVLGKQMEEKEKEREEMERKLQSGEISQKKYNKWKLAVEEEEWEADEAYYAQGMRCWEATERQAIAEKARLTRNAERK